MPDFAAIDATTNVNLQETFDLLNGLPTHLGWTTETLVRLALAGLAGAAVGLEREFRGRGAGLRTFMLVAVGAALVMVVSVNFAHVTWPQQTRGILQVDPGRIAYGVMTGIGFLGAGTIIRNGGNVSGLTTAAGLWATAAVGLAFGLGLYVTGIVATIVLFVTLYLIGLSEHVLPVTREIRVTLRINYAPDMLQTARQQLDELGLHLRHPGFRRMPDELNVAELHFELRIRGHTPLSRLENWAAKRDDVILLAVE
ncbi:MAG: MgtC/SapB family protein [Phycisphaerae bacterium]